uniref:ANF_receptor domain-containing protein n=1 Tax=Angiostrongylus cantonensis TaxID=6313 RepID=A0A0K0DL73_ANGCA
MGILRGLEDMKLTVGYEADSSDSIEAARAFRDVMDIVYGVVEGDVLFSSVDRQVWLAARSLSNVNTRPVCLEMTTSGLDTNDIAFLIESFANAQNSVLGLRIENSPIMGEIRFKGSKRCVILQHEARNQQGVTFSNERSEVTFEVDAEEMIPTSKTKRPESDLLNVIFKLRRERISDDFRITN